MRASESATSFRPTLRKLPTSTRSLRSLLSFSPTKGADSSKRVVTSSHVSGAGGGGGKDGGEGGSEGRGGGEGGGDGGGGDGGGEGGGGEGGGKGGVFGGEGGDDTGTSLSTLAPSTVAVAASISVFRLSTSPALQGPCV